MYECRADGQKLPECALRAQALSLEVVAGLLEQALI